MSILLHRHSAHRATPSTIRSCSHPLHDHPRKSRGSSHFGVWGWCSKRPGDHGQCRGTTTEHRSSPREPHQPKLARNSDTRTLCSTPKRCNSNSAISTFDIHAGELRATFLRNHNMRRHKDPSRRQPKRKTTQAQKTPATPTAATTATSTGALHPLRGGAPVTWRCTRTEEVHCLRIGCSAPTNKNKRGTGTPNHSPPHPSMRTWALLAAGWARRPRHHLHSGPLRPTPTPPTPLNAKSRLPRGRCGETSATTTDDDESTTIGYQDMRKARSRVDSGTGK